MTNTAPDEDIVDVRLVSHAQELELEVYIELLPMLLPVELSIGGEQLRMAMSQQEDMTTERAVSPAKVDRIKEMRAQGYTVREVVGALKVSPKTVLKYAPDASIVKTEERLEAPHMTIPTELVREAAKLGLTPVIEETTRRIYFRKLS